MADAKKEAGAAGLGKGMKALIGAMALALVVAVGAVSYLLGHKAAPAAAGGAEQGSAAVAESAKSSEPLFLALDPPFIVNFQDTVATRFLQISVQLMAHDQKALDAAKASEPAVRNALVMLFSSQEAKALASREGKEKLRADTLAEIQKIVGERAKGATLEAVYFTSFVMQ